MKYYRLNNRIRVPQVRLIDETGKFLNVVNVEEALSLARSKGLDLVEINPKENPPIVKIMDFGQFRYEETKKEKDKNKNVKKRGLKTIRLSLRTGKHDLEIKVGQASKFFQEGHKVRFEMLLRGRERAHQDLAEKVFQDLTAALNEVAKIEQPTNKQGNKLSIVLVHNLK